MSLPPFPSQDLAKLVLGYLAEEQLMTAYDEFLQASPYLDAFRNEYDRMFMTSLKNILAEYRAIKIYVETCKPFSLRRKLLQCSNLLEIVKFLIQNIDVDKLNTHVSGDKTRSEEIHTHSNIQPTSEHTDSRSFESVVEATPLTDLPGKQTVGGKKQIKVLEKGSSIVKIDLTSQQNNESLSNVDLNSKNLFNAGIEQNICNNANCHSLHVDKTNYASSHGVHLPIKSAEILEPSRKIMSKSHVVYNNSNSASANSEVKNNSVLINNEPRRMSAVGTFQDFATNITRGGPQVAVPHSNIPRNCNMRSFTTNGQNIMAKGPIKQYLIKIGSTCENMPNNKFICTNIDNLKYINSSVSNFASDQKIKILSDIRMDSSQNEKSTNSFNKIPPVLQNITSTPVMHTQSLVINGATAFRPTTFGQRHSFTKDEIMAMPTIILAPGLGPPNIPTTCVAQTMNLQTNNNTATTSNAPMSLEPLIIDVTSNSPIVSDKVNTESTNAPTMTLQNTSLENMLITTVNMTKNATVPKITTDANKADTPQIGPPKRKSSSTPRRTSHIRVLNFATPRRIFHETINEHERHPNSSNPVEVVISQSPKVTCSDTPPIENNDCVKSIDSNKVSSVCYTDSESMKENTMKENTMRENTLNVKSINKKSWDAELRALAVANNGRLDPLPKCNSKRKVSKMKERNRAEKKSHKIHTTEEEKSNDKEKTKSKHSKSIILQQPDEVIEQNQIAEAIKIPIKPTINIITGITQDNPKSNNIKANEEKHLDTPEMERLSLQNVIGTKLNISDLLETPYKQALYDIQMETPRFLGPDLPDEPISDIKISNIPTPRFFVDQPSPSFSTRPTDYSSGGSYYKPDDQDYIHISDESESTENIKEKHSKTSINLSHKGQRDAVKDQSSGFKSRPVRQCTKNVSYYNFSNFGKITREADDKIVPASTCSDTISNNGPNENKNYMESKIKQVTDNKSITRVKADKKGNTPKQRKSSVKRETSKSFIKIKPRRLTPTKKPSAKSKRTVSISPHNSTAKLPKKRIAEKTYITPLVALAPTKSRRKSSTPRKLHCTKTFHSESSGHDSPEGIIIKESVVNILPIKESSTGLLMPTTSEHNKKSSQINLAGNESDDISKIQEYIETSILNKLVCDNNETNLHDDLIKKGFDAETAKIIERDLLDTPLRLEESETSNSNIDKQLEKMDPSQRSTTDLLRQDEEDELELSIYECNEESNNFITYYHDETKERFGKQLPTLKDKFSMEVCIDDNIAIRLRATPFSLLLDQNPQLTENQDSKYREADMLLSNFKSWYTPMKDTRAQCYEIFDSTLTSLDTPLKANNSPKSNEYKTTTTEIILEVEEITEKIEEKSEYKKKEQSVEKKSNQCITGPEKEIMDSKLKNKTESKKIDAESKDKNEKEPKKRKRQQSGCSLDDTLNDIKKPRSETTQYLLTSTNIQNIDIESVLSKLHGP